jgi:hypothetical protein
MSDNFRAFQERLKELRKRADEYGDKDEIHKSLDTVEKAWESAAKAEALASAPTVKAALEATQRTADALAYNILFCNTNEVHPNTLLASVVKYQALEQIQGAFKPVAAQSLEEAVSAGLNDLPHITKAKKPGNA